MLQPDELLALFGKRLAHDVIGRRFDAYRVLPFLKVLPLELRGELALVGLDEKPQPTPLIEALVHHGDGHAPVRISGHFMLPDLLVEVWLRTGQRRIAYFLVAVLR